jgi:hypothetical protein
VARALGSVGMTSGVRGASVVVIGHGNVALDCARVLAKASPGLYDTDLAARVLPVLGDGVARISIVGRRGHVQGAFTIKELRELVNLQAEGHDTSFIVRAEELELGMTLASQQELNGPQGRPRIRIDKLLREAAARGMCGRGGRADVTVNASPIVSDSLVENCTMQMQTIRCQRESISVSFSIQRVLLLETMTPLR